MTTIAIVCSDTLNLKLLGESTILLYYAPEGVKYVYVLVQSVLYKFLSECSKFIEVPCEEAKCARFKAKIKSFRDLQIAFPQSELVPIEESSFR